VVDQINDRCPVSSVSVPRSVAKVGRAGTALKMKEILKVPSAGAETSWFSCAAECPSG